MNLRLLILMAAAGGLSLAHFSRFPVGSLNDDAKYVLLAESLARGSYADPSLIHPVPETIYPPGYALFLAPLVRLFAPRWVLLKCASLALTLLSGLLLWRLDPEGGLLVPALFLLNPVTAEFSGTVMSEPLFIFLTLASFWMFRLRLERDGAVPAAAFLASVSWAVLTRATGAVLAASLAASLLLGGRWKNAAAWLGAPVLTGLLWTARNSLAAQQASGYWGFWKAEVPTLAAHPGVWLNNAIAVAYLAAAYAGAGLVLPRTPAGIAAAVLVSGAAAFAAAAGARRRLADQDIPRPWTWAVVLFVSGYFLLQASWAALDARYVWPILPFLLMAVFWGIPSERGRKALALCLAISYARRHAALLKAAPPAAPRATYAWMRAHLPADARVLHPTLASLSLYTGLRGLPGLDAKDRDEFRRGLGAEGVRYALERPSEFLSVRGARGLYDQASVFEKNKEWVEGWPEAFRPIYENFQEGTILYSLRPAPNPRAEDR